ncbi:MAG: transcriptional regulator [Pirellulaceae bacterium]
MQFIHEPARLVVLSHLASIKTADFVFLLNSTELSRGNLSVQMSRMEEKGLVTVLKQFNGNRPQTIYEITRKGRAVLKKYRTEILDLLQDLPL